MLDTAVGSSDTIGPRGSSAIFTARRYFGLGLLAASIALSGCSIRGTNGELSEQGQQSTLAQGHQFAAEGNYEAALAAFEQIIAENPQLAVAHIGVGDIHIEQGDHKQAEKAYDKAAKAEPRNFRAQLKHGVSLQLLQRVADAVGAYLRALSIQPNDFEANRNLATAYLQLDEPAQAIVYARRSVDLAPDDGPARVNLGAVCSSLGQHNEAVTAYQAAAERMELTPELLLNLADSLGKAKRYQEMLNTLDQLLRTSPSAQAYERKGFSLFRLQRYDDALRAFEGAVVLDSKHYPAINGVAVCRLNEYEFSGRKRQEARTAAVEALRQSLRIDGKQPKIVDLLSRYQ